MDRPEQRDPGGITRPHIDPEPPNPTPCSECRGSGAREVITHPRRRRYFAMCSACYGTGDGEIQLMVAALRRKAASKEASPPPLGTFEPATGDGTVPPILIAVRGGALTQETIECVREAIEEGQWPLMPPLVQHISLGPIEKIERIDSAEELAERFGVETHDADDAAEKSQPKPITACDDRCAGCKSLCASLDDWHCSVLDQPRRPTEQRCDRWTPSDIVLAADRRECMRCAHDELAGGSGCGTTKWWASDGRETGGPCRDYVPAGRRIPEGTSYWHNQRQPVAGWVDEDAWSRPSHILVCDHGWARVYDDLTWSVRAYPHLLDGNRCHDLREAKLQAEDALIRHGVML